MGIHLAANVERQLDRAVDQFVALKFHLPPRDVKRSDDLQIRRCGCVREHRFVELLLHAFIIHVFHQHHRSLPQSGHRLMCGVGLIHT